ncbi:response regulator [Vibrio cincinnatiensis]|nr:response regulator [Vibrio cincinnatiensis]MCG3727718.1 response regulator [Vibrio cincinnatiensis]MCG3737382.1 response regulator [Vibrio cincinnatiensis]MCG3742648.1 response regulator [Vibrio cincinnatiensis]MCG3764601.1 response regulator [Vibrio cincinnatiensis]
MILEDDARASYMLESAINKHADFLVIAASESCADALIQYETFKPKLIFVDITLPDGNGIELIRHWRKQQADCDFIMMTAERETATVQKAIQLGVTDYLVKPIRISRVHQALEDYKQYKAKLARTSTVDQGEIDEILGKSPPNPLRQTPKGIDSTTLASLKTLLLEEQLHDFSADDIGEKMNVSRITARRYLEFLESEGIIRLVLNYKTGGRPRRLYQLI